MNRIAEGILRLRWPIAIALIIVSVFLTVRALDVAFDFSPRSMFLTWDPEIEYLAEFREEFGDEDRFVFVVAVSPDTVFTASRLAQIDAISTELDQIEEVDKVLSLTTVPLVRGQPGYVEVRPFIEEIPEDPSELATLATEATGYRLFVRRLVSTDSQAAGIMVSLGSGLSDEKARRPTIKAIEEVVSRHQGQAELDLYVNGLPVVQRSYAVLMQSDLFRSVGISAIAMLLALFVLFRNVLGAVVPLATVLVAVVWSVGIMQMRAIPFNIINAVVPTLLMVIGVSDAIHLVSRYYEELGAGKEKWTAIRDALREVGAACFLTSFTAAAGFYSLVVAKVDIIKELGRTASIGIGLAFAVIILAVPLLLLAAPKPSPRQTKHIDSGPISRILRWNLHIVTHHPMRVVAVTFVVAVVAAFGALRLEAQSFLLEEIRSSHPISIANKVQEEHLSGVLPVVIDIRTDRPNGALDPVLLRRQRDIIEALVADPRIGQASGLSDLIVEMNHVLRGEEDIPQTQMAVERTLLLYENSEDSSFLDDLTNFDRSRAPIFLTFRDVGSAAYFDWYHHWVGNQKKGTPGALADMFPPDVSVKVTGAGVIANRALNNIIRDMMASLSLAFLLIFLAMTILFRSLRIGVFVMLPNVLPLLLLSGMMGWLAIPLRTSTVLIFSLGLGLAVNDTIHFLARYRAERDDSGDLDGRIERTLNTTGRAIIFTSVILILGFLSLLSSSFIGIFQLGILGTTAIFGALLGDLFLLPVLLKALRIDAPKANRKEGAQ